MAEKMFASEILTFVFYISLILLEKIYALYSVAI